MLRRAVTSPTIHRERVLVRVEHPRGTYASRVLRRQATAFLRALMPGELSLVVTTDAKIRRLNRDHRGIDRQTDVLSFPQDPASGLLGDVVVSLDTAQRQARAGGRPLSDELARLLAHGLLHLVGHDHERPADARRMAEAEVSLLGRFGLVSEALGHPKELVFRRVRLRGARELRPAARRTKEST